MSTPHKCQEVYNKRQAGTSVAALADEYGVSQSSIRNWLKKAEAAPKAKAAKATPKKSVTDSGVSGVSEEVFVTIRQKLDEGASVLSLSKEFGLSRYKVDQIKKSNVVEHENNVVAISKKTVTANNVSVGNIIKVEEDGDELLVIGVAEIAENQYEILAHELAVVREKYGQVPEEDAITITQDEYYPVGMDETTTRAYDLMIRAFDEALEKGGKLDIVINTIVGRTKGTNNGHFYGGESICSKYEQHSVTVDAHDQPYMEQLGAVYATDKDNEQVMIDLHKIISVGGVEQNPDYAEVDAADLEANAQTTAHIKAVVDKGSLAKGAPRAMVTPNQIKLVVDNKVLTTSKGNNNFVAVAEAIKAKDYDKAIRLMDQATAIEEYSEGLFKVVNGRITYEGWPIVHDGFTRRIMYMLRTSNLDGLKNAAAFIGKLMDNPSNRVTGRIMDFMKFADIEMAEDGDIYAYKAVKGNYMDCHSGKISNTPGTVVVMRRNRVNENDNETCSYGLHVCSLSYLPKYAGSGVTSNRILRVKLSPADIVSIPTDYKDAKIRCCRYEVMEDVTAAYRQRKLKIDHNGAFAIADSDKNYE
ncbi:RIIB protein [Vibrio phage vB_VcorM_GR28A]|nr:RIIB protein [Vibrio phage vB_VcorM_GR28A]